MSRSEEPSPDMSVFVGEGVARDIDAILQVWRSERTGRTVHHHRHVVETRCSRKIRKFHVELRVTKDRGQYPLTRVDAQQGTRPRHASRHALIRNREVSVRNDAERVGSGS